MVKALLWKEWREQRPIVLTGILLAALLPFFMMAGRAGYGGKTDLATLVAATLLVNVCVLWPLFAAVAGAATISHEIGEGTLDFLLSRPVSRVRVWTVKLLLAALAIGLVATGSLIVVWIVSVAAGRADTHSLSLLLDQQLPLETLRYVLPVLAATFLLFGAAAYCSALFSRSMTAAAAALCLSLVAVAVVLAVWGRLDLVPRLEPGWVALELVSIGALLLAGSLVLFARADLAARPMAARSWAALGGAALMSLAPAVVPLLAAHAAIRPETARITSGVIAPAGDAVAAALAPSDKQASQLWLIPTDASPPQPLAGRLTWPIDVSPDGAWVAYLSARGPLGLRSDTVQLRVVRTDGAQDTLLTSSVSPFALYLPAISGGFSPDGSRLALLVLDELVVASMDGSLRRKLKIPVSPSTLLSVLGWTADGDEIILRKFLRGSTVRTVIVALDVQSGDERAVLELEAYVWPAWSSYQSQWPAGITWMPILWTPVASENKRHGGYRLELLDVSSGQRVMVSQAVCFGAADLQGPWLAYATCSDQEGAGHPQAAIHVRDLDTQADEIWTTLGGRIGELRLSRDGGKIAAEVLQGAVSSQESLVMVIDRRGSQQRFTGGWELAGWSGRDRVLLMKIDGPGVRQIVVADAERGDLRTVFPPPAPG